MTVPCSGWRKLPRAPPSISLSLGVRVSVYMDFEGDIKIQTIASRSTRDCWQFPEARRVSMVLLTTQSQTSRLQSSGRILFCGFKPPSLWQFVMAALGN